MKRIKVNIVYPTDPSGTVPGGIDTCIRDLLKYAPEDISISVTGVSTNRVSRPVGRWTKCRVGESSFDFFPVLAFENLNRQLKIPLSVRFTAALALKPLKEKYHILQFHRVEPMLRYFYTRCSRIAFIHTDMGMLKHKETSIRWKYLPWLYFRLEDLLLSRVDSVFISRKDLTISYRKRHPLRANRFHFLPTWADSEIFYAPTHKLRARVELELFKGELHETDDVLIVSVGRLDHEKGPLLLIDSFSEVTTNEENVRLIIIGDGVLKSEVLYRISNYNLNDKVALVGLLSGPELANYLRAADLLVLASAYEGMPRVVLEALACGLPVVSTDVGEVRRLVIPGLNGEISASRRAEDLASAIISCIKKLDKYQGKPCLDVAAQYKAEKVLEAVYENYRTLAGTKRSV